MRAGPGGGQLSFVRDLSDQGVPEAVAVARHELDLVDQLDGHQVGEVRSVRVGQECLHDVEVEVRADHRRRIEHRLGLRRKPVDAGRNHAVNRWGHSDLVDVSLPAVASPTADQHAAVDQVADHLLDEEGVARRGARDAFGDSDHRRVIADQSDSDRDGRLVGQRVQRDRGLRGAAQRAAIFGPVGGDERGSQRGQGVGELRHGRLAGRVDPVHVLEDEHRSART